jgi:hypothetical protein
VGIDCIWRYLGFLTARVEPAMNTLGGLDLLERTKRQECALELLPFDRVPYLVGPAVLILKVRMVLVPLNIKANFVQVM